MPDNAAINALTANTSEGFTLTVSDGSASDSKAFTVNLTGVNDTPVLSASLTSTTFTDTAGADTFSAVTGTLSTVERDGLQTQSYGVTGGSADTSVSGYDTSKAGTYGKLYVNASTGAYTYVPDNAAINALTANTSEGFTLTVSDGDRKSVV